MGICITLLVLLLGFTSWGDTSCEAYKQQVIADCDSALSTIGYIKNAGSSIDNTAWSGINSIQNNTDPNVAHALSCLETIRYNAGLQIGYANSLQNTVNAIRSVASDLVCTSSSGSCDCATVLGEISSKLTTVNSSLTGIGVQLNNILGSSADQGLQAIINNLESINDRDGEVAQLFANWDGTFEDIYNLMEEIHTLLTSNLEDIFPLWLALLQKVDPDKLENAINNLGDNLGLAPVLNVVTNQWFIDWLAFTNNKLTRPITSVGNIQAQYVQSFWNPSTQKYGFTYGYIYPSRPFKPTYENLLYMYADTIPRTLGSIATIEYLNYLNSATNGVRGILTDFTNQVAQGFSAVTNTLERGFSIFANDSPLRGYADNDYYTYLTNYYISVSVNPSGSASESYTNWFNRMEMLLAALVFKQETAKSNNFSTASTDGVQSALNGGLDQLRSIQENSSSVIQSVDKSSRSLLSALQGWNDQLSQAASLPSTIELVDLSVSSAPSTRDGGDSSSRIDLILSGGPLRTLCETTRAITTLCWCFVFLFSAWGLARFMVLKFSGIIKFCYAVFKTALGIG